RGINEEYYHLGSGVKQLIEKNGKLITGSVTRVCIGRRKRPFLFRLPALRQRRGNFASFELSQVAQLPPPFGKSLHDGALRPMHTPNLLRPGRLRLSMCREFLRMHKSIAIDDPMI